MVITVSAEEAARINQLKTGLECDVESPTWVAMSAVERPDGKFVVIKWADDAPKFATSSGRNYGFAGSTYFFDDKESDEHSVYIGSDAQRILDENGYA